MNEVKEWLSRGRRIESEMDALDAARRETFERLTNMVAPLDGVHAQGTKDPHAFDAYAAFEDRITRRTEELIRVRTEIIMAIEKVPDARYRELLINRYVRGMTWERIACEMHYSYRGVHKLHGAALQAVEPFIVVHTQSGVR